MNGKQDGSQVLLTGRVQVHMYICTSTYIDTYIRVCVKVCFNCDETFVRAEHSAAQRTDSMTSGIWLQSISCLCLRALKKPALATARFQLFCSNINISQLGQVQCMWPAVRQLQLETKPNSNKNSANTEYKAALSEYQLNTFLGPSIYYLSV